MSASPRRSRHVERSNLRQSRGLTAEHWVDDVARLGRCSHQLRGELARCSEKHGLSDTQFLLIWQCSLAGQPGLDQARIASHLGVSAAQVSGLVEQLGRMELIASQRDLQDRRRQLWRVTPLGQQVIARVLTEIRLPSRPWTQREFEQALATLEELAGEQTVVVPFRREAGGAA